MALCTYCKQDMADEATGTCTESGSRISEILGEAPIPFGEERDTPESERCPDCNIRTGGFHHPDCDTEECPLCHEQLIACGDLEETEWFSENGSDGG